MAKEEFNIKELDLLIDLYFLNFKKATLSEIALGLKICKCHPYLQKILKILKEKKIMKLTNIYGSMKLYEFDNSELRYLIIDHPIAVKWAKIMPNKFDIIR